MRAPRLHSWADAYLKIRKSGDVLTSLFSSLTRRRRTSIEQRHSIAIVGIGIAALTFAEELKSQGYANVTLIAPNDFFGGTCVHTGCIPSESFWKNPAARTQIVTTLDQALSAKVKEWGYEFLQDRLKEIKGNTLHFEKTAPRNLDRIILATGANIFRPVHGIESTLSANEFWNLKRGDHLLILENQSPAAWSWADMAIEMGCSCTILSVNSHPLMKLPSFQAFTEHIQNRGVQHFPNSTGLTRINEHTVGARSGGAFHEFTFTKVMTLAPGRFASESLPIDGEIPTVFDLDLETGSLKRRPDILFLGDASGFLSAAEAEVRALQLAWSSTGQTSNDLESILQIPMRLTASTCWASVGKPLEIFAHDWPSIGFELLGSSLIEGTRGRLWYQYERRSKRVTSLQICHPQAGELIALGSALIQQPLTSAAWLTSSVHPSSAEIFKVLARQIRSQYPFDFLESKKSTRLISAYLGPMTSWTEPHRHPQLKPSDFRKSLLEPDPWLHLALTLSTQIFDQTQSDLKWDSKRRRYDIMNSNLEYEYNPALQRVEVRQPGRSAHFIVSATT